MSPGASLSQAMPSAKERRLARSIDDPETALKDPRYAYVAECVTPRRLFDGREQGPAPPLR
ncbi:MAG: hypothetical protein NVSMB9_33000 [Isosphaeraceae bacterium]